MNQIVLNGDEEYRLFESAANGNLAWYIAEDVQLILKKCSDMRMTIDGLTAEIKQLTAERDGYKSTISKSIAEHELERKLKKKRKEWWRTAGLFGVLALVNLVATMIAMMIVNK